MKNTHANNSLHHALRLAVLPAAITWSLITLTFLLPVLDSTNPPYFDLTGKGAEIAYWLAWSGSKYGAPVLALLLIIVFETCRPISVSSRLKEGLFIAVVATIFAGGGAAFNENVLKAELKVPRPNVTLLAGAGGSGPLGMTAEQFYLLDPGKPRSEVMASALAEESLPIAVGPLVASHWVDETGFSFPSGHAFAAMLIASFFLSLAVSCLSIRNARFFYLLLPWALAVCFSRPILRVHTPLDITVGGLLGVFAGLAAWLLVTRLLRRTAAS